MGRMRLPALAGPAGRASAAGTTSFAIRVLVLFVASLCGGFALQLAGVLPGHPRAVIERLLGAPQRLVPLRGSLEVADIHAPRVNVAPPSVPLAAAPIAAVPLLGDEDSTRNALRRGVVVAARASLAAPCDTNRRAAFQIALRDYARAYASSPRSVGERAEFRTPLDGEATRAVATAMRAGLIEAELVNRWRSLERTGVDEILRRERLTLAFSAPDACPRETRRT